MEPYENHDEDMNNELDNNQPTLDTAHETTQGDDQLHSEDVQQTTVEESTTGDTTAQEEMSNEDREQNTIPSQEDPVVEATPTAEETGKKKKKEKNKDNSFLKKHRNGIVMGSCFLLAGVGGFGGSLIADNLGTSSGKTVLYQSVDSSGNTTTNTSTTDIKAVANKTMESVVEIKTESMTTQDFFQQAVTSGAGSGVVLSKDGYIVTNNHVIEGANKVTVTTKDGKEYTAKLIGTDSTTDLAVIKVEATDLTPAVLGDSSKLEVGDTAVAIGNPLGSLGGTVTSGIISALDREITIDNETMHLLQTNAAINPGNSGGGLFNSNGELIGVVNAKSSGSDIEGLGFAIPINKAKPVIESLMENGYVTGRAELGVSLVEASDQNSNPFGGSSDAKTYVYIQSVTEGKAADEAGLQRGDKIIAVDGEEVSSAAEVKAAVSAHSAGDKMTMKIERDGSEKTVTITLQEQTSTTTKKTSYSTGA